MKWFVASLCAPPLVVTGATGVGLLLALGVGQPPRQTEAK
jgi:hypothetical protein